MVKIRNQTHVKQIMIRDMGLCRCCGFKASEVHHVIPIIYNGEDHPRNMIALCYTCHRDAPDTKEEFFEYMKSGGARTPLILGKISQMAQKMENDSKGEHSFSLIFHMGRKIFSLLRGCDFEYSKEKYNLKESLQVEDVDFSLER